MLGCRRNSSWRYRPLIKIDLNSRQDLILRCRFPRESCRSRRDLQLSLGNLPLRMRSCLRFDLQREAPEKRLQDKLLSLEGCHLTLPDLLGHLRALADRPLLWVGTTVVLLHLLLRAYIAEQGLGCLLKCGYKIHLV